MIVTDTNIIFNYVADSKSHEDVIRFAEFETQWAAPLFWRVEFLNILATNVRLGEIQQGTAYKLWESVNSLERLKDFSVDENLAFELALKYGVSNYDAQFLALAHELKTVVVTGDLKLIRAAPQFAKNYMDFFVS